MTTPIPNEFQEYKFPTERDELEAMVFNANQLAYLSNIRAQMARTLLNLTGIRKDYDAYLEQNLHLKGQLDLIELLVNNHEQATQAIAQLQE